MIDPDNRTAENRLTEEVKNRRDAGEDVVVVREPDRINAATRLPGSRNAYLYASRDFNVPGFQQSIRAARFACRCASSIRKPAPNSKTPARRANRASAVDRKGVVKGKGGEVSVKLGGRRNIKK